MLNKLIFLLFTFVLMLHSQSELYKSFNFQNAYENKTRSLDGNPGENYWQNYSDYKIKAEVNVEESILTGETEITYFNESPDSLNKIVIRLYQNNLKNSVARDRSISPSEINDGVEIKNFKINGEKYDLQKAAYTATNLVIPLQSKLSPNSSISFQIEWQIKIPSINKMRMGNYQEGEMFIAYWYPQISVYDDIDGWDLNEYYGIVEFYNDFNNYDVEIKLPPKFLLWSTGEIQNMESIFKNEIIGKFNEAKESDKVVRIVTKEDHQNNSVFKTNEKITYHIKAESVPDFSFAISDSYNWDGVTALVDESTGRKSLAQAAYEDETIHYENAALYTKETLEYLSNVLPGYPYPYPEMTSYSNKNSSGGMETPMMANNGVPISLHSHVGLIFHETAHNYFPFMMGNNERKYSWMDEGWAAFLPFELVQKIDPDYDYLEARITSYETTAGKEGEIPLMVPSYSVKGSQIRTNFYNRPASAYNELMELLGRDIFKEAVLEYMNRWIGKHPVPYDFFYTIDDYTKEDLSWFWKPWFFEFGYPDLSIKNVELKNDIYNLTIEKNGNIPTRIYIKAYSEDGSFVEVSKNAKVWASGDKEIFVEVKSEKDLVRFELGNSHIPDANKANNLFEGFLK